MRKAVFSLMILLAVGVGFIFGWELRSHVSRLPDQMAAVDRPTVQQCETVQSLGVYFKSASEPSEVEWQLFPQPSGEAPLHYVRAHDFQSDRGDMYTFGPADEIVQLVSVDFYRDGKQELLVVARSNGTGAYINWCVLGWTAAGLRCWSAPDVDGTARKLIRNDEDFCCKGWTLKLSAGGITLGEGIYHKGVDGNCCPSRGGAFVELSPARDSFAISKVWREDAPAYGRWLRSP